MTPAPDITDRFAFALALVREAGDHARGFLADRAALEIRDKGPQDMASQADLETELLIRSRLDARFPGDGFLGEETGATAFAPGQGVWVVDPIDGTQPYVSGLPSWCVSIGFVRDGAILFGMVYAPALGELYAGGVGIPATVNGAPVERHPGRSIREGITAFGYSPRVRPAEFLPMFGRFLEAGGVYYRDGSGALMLCHVAAGRLVGYIEPHINSWDCVGALAVIHAAGLESNDFLAGDGLRKGNWLVAGPPEVRAELEAIRTG
ncbi:inositol monophosphatase [Amaricoccus sp.]|uniref:inositol monophosphatase family protein n=1 Tax=Amaricoccus sp. TaxID=1872485 RepID=UPI001B4D399C|nr:inositol monophosphatase [Amaricoccus sp.]MBP7001616.1 inositol monophosphatase [Amaricoccus sp.]